MALTFRHGPNAWCDPDHACKMGYTRYVPTAADLTREKAARSRKPASSAPATRAPAAAAPRVPTPTPGRLPPAPEHSRDHVSRMTRAEMDGEREKLEAWMVKVAALPLSKEARAEYDAAKHRADELYCMAMLAR